MTSHLFGGVWCSSSSSTFAMRRTVEDKPCSKFIEETAMKSFYVDDLLKSVQEFDEAVEVVIKLKKVLKYGGFNLTKFVTNDVQLLKSIEVGDRAKEVKEITPELYSKVLGIKWEPSIVYV